MDWEMKQFSLFLEGKYYSGTTRAAINLIQYCPQKHWLQYT